MPDSEQPPQQPLIKQGAHGRSVPSRTEMVVMVAALMALNALAIDIMLPALGEIASATGLTGALPEDANRQQLICMLKNGDADGMVTGVTRNYDVALNDSLLVLDPIPGQAVIGMSMVINRGRTVFIADTSVTELPQGEDLANIAMESARAVRSLGFSPRVAFLSYSTFGNPMGERGEKVREAVAILDSMGGIDFEYEGDMSADVALNPSHKLLYPFSRLTGPANVLVMPAIHAASISTKLLESMSRATVIGPMLLGLEKPVQIASLGATVGDIVNLATIAAFDVDHVHGS